MHKLMILKRRGCVIVKKIYLVRTDTGTIPSKIIDIFLKEEYVHLSISLDKELSKVYSFGRIKSLYPLKGGFQKEVMTDFPFWTAPTQIHELVVTERAYKEIKKKLNDMDNKSDNYSFNILGLVPAYLKIPWNRKSAYFCSEYITEILKESQVITSEIEPSVTTPEELISELNTKVIFEGVMSEYIEMQPTVYLTNELTMRKQST